MVKYVVKDIKSVFSLLKALFYIFHLVILSYALENIISSKDHKIIWMCHIGATKLKNTSTTFMFDSSTDISAALIFYFSTDNSTSPSGYKSAASISYS